MESACVRVSLPVESDPQAHTGRAQLSACSLPLCQQAEECAWALDSRDLQCTTTPVYLQNKVPPFGVLQTPELIYISIHFRNRGNVDIGE